MGEKLGFSELTVCKGSQGLGGQALGGHSAPG